ncbi:MAG: Holliday junction resolvase RecU [Bacilli bacterium]
MNKTYSILGFNKENKNNVKSGFSNRGLELENDINLSNEYYKIKDIAYIYKKPTPIKLVKVDYSKAQIKEAYFMAPSTTDYNGIYQGKYIDFEAKETNSKTSFSLANIHPHQIDHLINVYRHGGISFVIIRFNMLNHTYLLETKCLLEFIKDNNRKSIPICFFKENASDIKIKFQPRVDYLEIIKKLYFGGNNYDEEKKS